jgi:anti-sigma regulatory factor (Ser/Thr protein kinase)
MLLTELSELALEVIAVSGFASLVVPAQPESVKSVRDWVAATLTSWGHDPYVGRLVVTELVTNAWKHTTTKNVTVRVGQSEAGPVIEVLDSSIEMPVVRPQDVQREDGRGLAILSTLVKDWGAQPLATGGKAVWAVLPVPASGTK